MLRLIATLALLLVSCLPVLPVHAQQGQQYTAQVLPAPAGAPGPETRAAAINNLGQVFGIAGNIVFGPISYVPVIWTGGVPSILPFPDGSGYHLAGCRDCFGENFINDSGTVVSVVHNDAVANEGLGRRPKDI